MDVITLVDNVVYGNHLRGEHGLSFFIRYKGKHILFDTGQSDVLLHNANALSIELNDVDAVVISHGHADHMGGLEDFLCVNGHATIYVKKSVFDANGHRLKKPLQDYPNPFVFLEGDLEIFPGVTLISDINRYSNSLDQDHSFFEKEAMSPIFDPFSDELFMVIEHAKHQNIFTGCSHVGILNILKTAYEKNNHKKIRSLCGGMYFNGYLLDRLDEHIKALAHLGLEKMYVNHCTGIDGYMRIKSLYPTRVHYAFTGYQFEIN